MRWVTMVWVCLLATSAWAGDPCETQANQGEINWCAKQRFGEQDKLLKAVYQRLLATIPAKLEQPRVSGVSPKAALIRSQRAWLNYREAHCRVMYELYISGSLRDGLYFDCMRERTEVRIKELSEIAW